MTGAALILLGLAAICFAARLLIGPSLSDRVMALDGIVIVGVALIAVRAAATGNGSFLPVAVVVTMVGFVSTAASARFIEGRSGADDSTPPAPETAAHPTGDPAADPPGDPTVGATGEREEEP